MNIKWLCIVAGAMAILAILPWPYAYYQLLRWLVFVSAAIVAYKFYKSKFRGWTLAFGVAAMIFNPIFPIFLSRSLWTIIDIAIGVAFLLSSVSYRRQ